MFLGDRSGEKKKRFLTISGFERHLYCFRGGSASSPEVSKVDLLKSGLVGCLASGVLIPSVRGKSGPDVRPSFYSR